MRTTLNLPDDVYSIAANLARSEKVSMGEAVATLVRRGLEPKQHLAERNGFPCFPVRPGAEPITLEQTLAAIDEAL